MQRTILLTCLLSLIAVGAKSSSVAAAEITRREANQLGVDVVTLRIGGDVRGVILDRSPTQIHMAVRHDWLAANQPQLLANLPAQPSGVERYEDLVDRIDKWLAELGAADEREPYAPQPKRLQSDTDDNEQKTLLNVLREESELYREYANDPLKLPPGEGNADERREAYRQLASKLDSWIDELDGKPMLAQGQQLSDDPDKRNRDELIRILKSERATYVGELKRLKNKQLADAPEFIRVTLSRADVKTIYDQSPERKQLVVAAFQHETDGVEDATVSKLRQQLDQAGIDWDNPLATPTSLVGVPTVQSDREWAARRAIYEYQFLSKLEFQGTGNFIAQTGENAPPPNLADVLQGVMQQQQSLALGDLLDEPIFTGLDFGGLGGAKNSGGWKTKAIRIAQQKGVRGVRVTRMTPNLQRRQTIVEDQFLAKMPNGSWETIWQVRETKSARNANQNDLDRIKQDPQLKEVLELVESLGLGNTGQLDLALQFGAATMNAQQATDDEFYEFRDRYSQSLDGPPLDWK